jgi:long-chain acyl-CoA synthetase
MVRNRGRWARLSLARSRSATRRARSFRSAVDGTVFFANGPDFAYHNDPGKTEQSRNQYGWTTLGDVGRLDGDGYLYLTDRQGFMIISGGVNIYPQELENLLVTHPKIADAAVIGARDPEMAEKVVAVVQPMDRAGSRKLDRAISGFSA